MSSTGVERRYADNSGSEQKNVDMSSTPRMRRVNDEAELPEHVRRNRVHWDARAAEYVGPGEGAWARQEPTWGIWRVPDSALHVLPENLAGQEVIELGCGTAYLAAWLARRGAR